MADCSSCDGYGTFIVPIVSVLRLSCVPNFPSHLYASHPVKIQYSNSLLYFNQSKYTKPSWIQHLISLIIAFQTVPAIDTNKSPGAIFTLKELHKSDNLSVVSVRYLQLAETSAIRTQLYSHFSSKYFGSSIGLGEAHRLTLENVFIQRTSHPSGISPIQSMLVGLYFG